MISSELVLFLLAFYAIAGAIIALVHAAGYSLTPDLGKLAEARAWKRQRAELNAAVVARRVKS